MRHLILIALLTTGCGTWKVNMTKTLVSVKEVADGAEKIGMPIIKKHCNDAVKLCADMCKASIEECKENPIPFKMCPALSKCQDTRELFVTAINAARYAVIDGKLAIQVMDEEQVYLKIMKAVKLADFIRQQVCLLSGNQEGSDLWATMCK